MFPPQRIVCLTEETVETLYLIGEDARIVGVSGFAVRPPRVRREKPRISAFTVADIDGILALSPDLVFTYSDLQADIVAQLIRRGIAVHAFNHHDLAGIFDMIRMVGAIVGAAEKAEALAREFEQRLEALARRPADRRPRVCFEEWSEPIIVGSRWVSELIEVAGGSDVFAGKARQKAGKDASSCRARWWRRPPTSSSDHGAARNLCRDRWPRVRALPPFRRCRGGGFMKSTPR